MRAHVAALLALAFVAACVASGRVDIEPRWSALRSSFAAMGMTPLGEGRRGTLAHGAEARIPVALDVGCVTIVAIAGDGARDVDLALADASGQRLAHDTTREAQATLRACVEAAATYTIVVRMTEGAGDFIVSAWSAESGGASSSRVDGGGSPNVHATGACEAPFPLVAGTVVGTTALGVAEQSGSCGRSSAKEMVYALNVASRTHLRVTLHASFDTVLYLRRGSCTDAATEIACNDDAPGGGGSALDAFIDPGVYYLFVDALGDASGAFRLATEMTEVPPVAEICRQARALVAGSVWSGTTVGAYDNASATCGEGAAGLDVPFKLDVPRRSRVRVVEHSDDVKPVVHVRRVCADEPSEIACAEHGITGEDAAFVGLLEAGAYTVFADATSRDAAGRFTLRADVAPEQGSGVSGDGCGDAASLALPDKPGGDTFLARDDVAGSCGGSGAPDVVYRIDLARRTRFSASIDAEEGRHVLVLSRACGDRSSEIACSARVSEALAPGVYFLAVDGATPGSFGRFTLDVRARDIGAQETACKSPPEIVAGRTINASSAGAGDKFSTTCGGRDDVVGGGDRVFRLVATRRTHVQLLLATPTWDGVLALRRSCVDLGASPRSSELRCNNDAGDSRHSKIDMTIEAGTYWVIVDGQSATDEGAFTLEYKILP